MESPQKTVENGNLGRFKAGNKASRGWPKGGISITAAIRRKLAERCPDATNTEKRTYAEMLVQTILDKALIERDVATMKLIWHYIDGLPKAQMTLDVDTANITELTNYFRSVARPKDLAQTL